MSLYGDFLPYRDRFGMNQLTSTDGVGDVSQNGALFTMEYLICLLEDDQSTIMQDTEVARLFSVFSSLERVYGLSFRTPESNECDSMDNCTALLAFSTYAGGSLFAERMSIRGRYVECNGADTTADADQNAQYLAYAKIVTAAQVIWRPWLWKSWFRSKFGPKYFWNNYNSSSFSLRSWFGRSPGFLGILDLAAHGRTTPIRWLSVLVGQFLGCLSDTGNTDARKLPYITWFMLTKCTGWEQRWFWKLMYRLWVYILLKQYPNGMRDVYGIYYQDPNHPIKKWSKRYFGEKT